MAKKIMIIPAAGVGRRFGGKLPKQYQMLLDLPILLHTLRAVAHPPISLICLNLAPEDKFFRALQTKYASFFASLFASDKLPLIVLKEGGKTRAETVARAFHFLAAENLISDEDWVLTHDAVRPCLEVDSLRRLITTLEAAGEGGILAGKVTATVKRGDDENRIIETLKRDKLWLAQTPQMFLSRDFERAYEEISFEEEITDEAALMEKIGKKPLLVPGDAQNIKITTPADCAYAEYLLREAGA